MRIGCPVDRSTRSLIVGAYPASPKATSKKKTSLLGDQSAGTGSIHPTPRLRSRIQPTDPARFSVGGYAESDRHLDVFTEGAHRLGSLAFIREPFRDVQGVDPLPVA